MQNTGDEFGELLGVLTVDELQQYGRVAFDQVARADRWFNVQVPLLAAGLALALWGLWLGLKSGFSMGTLYWIGPGLFVAYWLARSTKTRRLWREHISVVNDELERRGEGTMATGPELQ